jgi:hypothetical protein
MASIKALENYHEIGSPSVVLKLTFLHTHSQLVDVAKPNSFLFGALPN